MLSNISFSFRTKILPIATPGDTIRPLYLVSLLLGKLLIL
ncbi:hypothetical protein TCARB_0405 [Thermofilum adornatum 1505]|uniref:Uncharacterized protein n=1 Tax=Thermofilum adornatum 1505 TaxID=697581 RepID=A0A3G1A7Z8_9CREN|nr:hypothetical protein TCARB_0405 [Thermofilum adornatum 1505]